MSDLPTTSFKDENFQSQHAAKCDLLIQFSESTFSYAVIDQIQDQLKFLYSASLTQSAEKTLKTAFSEDAVFNYNFRKVKVSIETDQFTFIPSEAYSEEMLPAYSKFSSPQSDAETHVAQIRNASISTVLSVNSSLKNTLLQKFSAASIFSQAEPFIESALKVYYKPIKKQAFIQLSGHNFELLLVEGKKVLFYNLFQNSTVDEFNYFLLFAISQLQIDAREIPVILSGEINEGDERYKRIQKYFQDVSFADSSKLIRIPNEADGFELHQYFSSLSLNVCA